MSLGRAITILVCGWISIASYVGIFHFVFHEDMMPNGNKNVFVVPCQEDEVAAPVIDHNPSHRLSWHCINREELSR